MMRRKLRATKVGWDIQDCDVQSERRRIEHSRRLELEGKGQTEYIKQDYVFDCAMAVMRRYLVDDYQEAREWAEQLLDYAEEYFFGRWREEVPLPGGKPPSREWRDLRESWVMQMQAALLCSAALGDWDRFHKFAGFPRDDIREDEGISAACDAFWLYFCGLVRGRPRDEIESFRERVFKEGKKLDKLLVAFVEGVVEGDDQSLQEAADAYFKQYKRTQAKKDYISSKLALDGSIVLHYARHLGREVSVPEKVRDHIFELP